jgi:predicted metal-dependent hydrolase
LKNRGGEIDDFVILKKLFRFKKLEEPKTDAMQVGSRTVPLLMVHHPRARRYLLRLRPDGTVRVTIPRRGNISAARDFASRNVGWLEQQFQRLAARPKNPDTWILGTEIHFRGELVRIEPDADGSIRFSTERMNVPDANADLRPAIQKHLRALASKELPLRVMGLASLHGMNVSRVTVRNQKSRWGSCSRRGTISLNWRLIQTPEFVRDYIILHELAHRRQMNHSEKFWQEMKHLFPDYLQVERWLKQHSNLLR